MPASGAKFPKDAADWKWWRPEVPGKIKQAYAEGYVEARCPSLASEQLADHPEHLSPHSYAIVILSNQAGQPAQQKKMFDKMPLIGAKLDVPFHCFAALGYDQYRKPGTGMIELFFEEYNEGVEVDVASSVYVGDAAGRPARMGMQEDHSDADRSEYDDACCAVLTTSVTRRLTPSAFSCAQRWPSTSPCPSARPRSTSSTSQ